MLPRFRLPAPRARRQPRRQRRGHEAARASPARGPGASGSRTPALTCAGSLRARQDSNLRVPRAEFAAVWAAAEAHQEEQARRQVADWYGAGVVMTCRWVAGATVRPANGPWRPARSPVTERLNQAYEELIEAEYFAAE